MGIYNRPVLLVPVRIGGFGVEMNLVNAVGLRFPPESDDGAFGNAGKIFADAG